MNVEDIQSTIATMIGAHAALDGITVLLDDGTWPLTPARETVLETDGVVIIIWEPTGGSKSDGAVTKQRGIYEVDIPISVEENRVANQSTGLNKAPDMIVREIIKAIGDPFITASEAWANLGDIAGIKTRLINIEHKTIF
jgi:hypothetical protein